MLVGVLKGSQETARGLAESLQTAIEDKHSVDFSQSTNQFAGDSFW